MDSLAVFGLQLVLSVTVFALIAAWFVAPWLAVKPTHLAMTLLILPHAFRHVGLSFFVPSLVGDSLPSYFAYTVAFGDFASGLLAIASLIALRNRWAFAIPLIWVFNIVGTVDLIHALVQKDAVPQLVTTWYIPTFWVPVLLVTHVMIFSRLFSYARRHSGSRVTSATLAGAMRN